ncbi:MAG: polysaccharide deacetylase family protein [bacterium]
MKISVVVPAYNEEEFLPSCLEALLEQDFEDDYEVIVVDNASTDRTARVARDMGVIVVREPRKGITFARQKGLEVARGEIIAYVDADTIVPPHWLRAISDSFRQHPEAVAVSGPIPLLVENPIKRYILRWCYLFLYPFLDSLIRRSLRKGNTFYGANFAVRKSALLAIGGFNTRIHFYGEDVDTSIRLSRVGRLLFVRSLAAYTSPRRFEQQGLLSANRYYLATYFGGLFFNRIPIFEDYEDFRRGPVVRRHTRRRKFLYPSLAALAIVVFLIFAAVSPISQVYGRVYYRGPVGEKAIALTFDDGPNEPYTSQVLDILKRYGVRATFFEIGKNVERFPDASRRIVQEGHVIGNHSYSHPRFLSLEKGKFIAAEIDRTSDVIYYYTGLRPRLFRPPHGWHTPLLLGVAKDKGIFVIEWSDMTDDYNPKEDGNSIVNRILKNARPGGIIVLHDGFETKHGVDRGQMVSALPRIIEGLEKKGYRFVTLPEMLNLPAYFEDPHK